MRKRTRHGRVALAALFAAAAMSSAVPAHASTAAEDCDVRLDRIMAQFREIEDRRGYEDATEWWYKRWHAYYQSCGGL